MRMVLHSMAFIIFSIVAWLAQALLPGRWRIGLLLLLSLGLYSSLMAPGLLVALAAVAMLAWRFGIKIDQATGRTRSLIMWIGISSIVGVLFLTKYFPSFETAITKKFLWSTVGVSYFILQGISYLVDVYLETQAAEKRLAKIALYLSFFPKLLQGPIERAGDIIPQLEQDYKFDYSNVRDGLVRFCWGLFKKLVIADRLAVFVDSIYGDVHACRGVTLLLGTVLYACQVYVDFSSYTDMAIGIARTLNVKLSENFNKPYMATSVVEFWRRWHISFSRWLLDYIFKPLQVAWRGMGKLGTAAALVITFLISGLWHGANCGYIVWGGLHGCFMAISLWVRPWKDRLYRAVHLSGTSLLAGLQIALTFCLVCFTWIFFRAATLLDAVYVISHLFDGMADAFMRLLNFVAHWGREGTGLREFLPEAQRDNLDSLAIALSSLAAMYIVEWIGRRRALASLPLLARWIVYLLLLLGIGMLATRGSRQFIYAGF